MAYQQWPKCHPASLCGSCHRQLFSMIQSSVVLCWCTLWWNLLTPAVNSTLLAHVLLLLILFLSTIIIVIHWSVNIGDIMAPFITSLLMNSLRQAIWFWLVTLCLALCVSVGESSWKKFTEIFALEFSILNLLSLSSSGELIKVAEVHQHYLAHYVEMTSHHFCMLLYMCFAGAHCAIIVMQVVVTALMKEHHLFISSY